MCVRMKLPLSQDCHRYNNMQPVNSLAILKRSSFCHPDMNGYLADQNNTSEVRQHLRGQSSSVCLQDPLYCWAVSFS